MLQKLFQLFALVAVLGLSACSSYPSSSVEQGRGDAGIYFIGAPEGAVAYVDGIQVGLAADYDGREQILGVVPGRHRVEVKSASQTIFDEEIYVGAESHIPLLIR